jgi:hypothetical protein
MQNKALLASICVCLLLAETASSAIVDTTGSVVIETNPYPLPSDTEIFVFDEKQAIEFVSSQSLNFGSIAAGTLVNSHYAQYDPESPTGFVDGGTITFDGAVLGVVTATPFLNQDLSADGAGTSDSYFGLSDALGPYPTGDNPNARGLGTATDELVIELGSDTLGIISLEIPPGGEGNIDAFRVFTAFSPTEVPSPPVAWLFASGILGLTVTALRKRAA